MNLLIFNDYFKKKELTPDELFVYSSLCPFSGYISLKAAAYNLYGEDVLTRKIYDKYKNIVNALIEKEMISVRQINKEIYYMEKIDKPKTNYTMIPFEYLQKIGRSVYRSKGSLFYYLCWVASSRINKMHLGLQKMSYFVYHLDTTENTIISYNKALEKMHILYVRRENGNEGKANCYGLYEDKDEVDRYALEHGYGNDVHITSNWLRSVCQKYNYLIAHPGKKTTIEDMERFRSYNKYCEERTRLDPLWEKSPLDLTILKDKVII